MHTYLHTVLHTMRRMCRFPSLTELSRQPRVMARARILVEFYYYIFFFAAFLYTTGNILSRPNFDPLPTIAWARYVDYPMVVYLVFALVLSAGAAGALLSRYRSVRFLVFLVVLQLHAFESSFGGVNHQWYLWLYSSFIFVFLPDIWTEKKRTADTDRLFLLAIWWAQAVAMMMYTLAGYHKLYAATAQWWAGQVGGFSVDAFAYQIADWLPRLQTQALMGPFIIEHPAVGWAPYVFIQFFQFFSLWVMVRLPLQRIWAWGLILFHIATFFTMGISFHPLILALIALFMYSPFIKEPYPFRDFLLDLPIIGQCAEWYLTRRRA